MNDAFRIFTVSDGAVTDGAKVEKFVIQGAGVEIPAILVGEEGRGRRLGVLPVAGAKPDDTIVAAELGLTRSGKPKLIARSDPTTTDKAIVVLWSPIGYRGSNEHTGDRSERWHCIQCGLAGDSNPPARCPTCGPLGGIQREFLPFPGEVLVQGRIADGEAGRVGSGEQLVALVPQGVWFRVGFSGRRYGAPMAWYYRFDGNQVIAVTWEERQLLEQHLGEYEL